MAMAEEEENFIRIFKLVSGVAPKAVRVKFDKYFPPVNLTTTMKQVEPKLKALHAQKRLTTTQMALLFPTTGVTASGSYDVTLMICLLRNLTSIPPPKHGFDMLPPSTEIHDGADLARVKYYRNKIAHSDKDALPTPEFTTIWKDLEQALVRLGGSNFVAMCKDIKQDILLEVRHDIRLFREEIKLQLDQNVLEFENKITAVKQTQQETTALMAEVQAWKQDTTATMTEVQAWQQETTATMAGVQTVQQETTATMTEVQAWKQETTATMAGIQEWKQETTAQIETFAATSREIKQKVEECSCHDTTVPSCVPMTYSHEPEILQWEQEEKNFVKTHVVDVILKKLETNHCITVTGKPGMGKSTIIHHIALLLHKNQGYAIVPCTDPKDTQTHYKKDRLQLFVFDDVCGRYKVNIKDVEEWLKREQNIKNILSNKKAKILSSCRLQVFSEEQFQNINMLKECSIDLNCDEHSLTMQEKTDIALKYLDQNIVDTCKDILEKCEFLPLMCYLCKQNPTVNVQDFLSNPFDIYNKELYSMKKDSDNTKWCALFLCILHDGKIEESFFGQELDNKRQELQTIVDHCSSKPVTTKHFKEQLESLVGTYIKKTEAFVEHNKKAIVKHANESRTYLKKIKTLVINSERRNANEKVWYTIIHDKMFDFLCHYFGSDQQKIFIKHAKASVLGERTQLESLNKDHDQFTVIISKANEVEFFQRIVTDWKGGDYVSVFNYYQMKFKQFRAKLISYIKMLGPDHLRMSCHDLQSTLTIVCKAGYYDMFCFLLVQKSVVNHNDLLESACYGGNVDIVKRLINMGGQVNILPSDEFDCSFPLLEACTCGHLPVVILLIDKGADVNQTTDESSPLIAACKGGHLPIVTLLINKGADVNQTTDESSPLSAACKVGHLPIVTFLIDKGANVNLTTEDSSPLTEACKGGYQSIVTLLIDKGADVNKTIYLYSPLISACHGGHLPIFSLLIDKGADVNKTTYLYSPLMEACKVGNESMVTSLIDKGADVNKTIRNYSPLILACEGGHLPIVTLLIDRGADVNKTTYRNSPLLEACKGGNESIVTLLIDKGADVNQTGKISFGKSKLASVLMLDTVSEDVATEVNLPLIVACESGHLQIVTLLIDKGVDVNRTTEINSPLIAACQCGEKLIVSLLIDKGADVNQTIDNSSALIEACKDGNDSIVTLLVAKGADVNQVISDISPLTQACRDGNEAIVTFLIENGADVNKTTNMCSSLIEACKGGNEAIVTLLIDKGADVNQTVDCKYGNESDVNQTTDYNSPLIEACKGINESIVALLIDRGADINSKTYRKSLLISACKGGNESIVTLLIDNGADVNQTIDDSSPLIEACKGGNESIVTLLIDNGADVNQTIEDSSPLIEACKDGNEPIITLLIDNGADVNQTIDNNSPLIEACEDGNEPIVTLLIERGADVNRATYRNSPLIAGCEGGNLSIVTLLIDKGADVNKKIDYSSSLIEACIDCNEAIVTLLLDKGADVNQTTEMYSPLIEACKGGNELIVTLLIDKGADVNKAIDDSSPLIESCRSGNESIVYLLIGKGAKLNL